MSEEELEQLRIDKEEKLEHLEKCVDRIKDAISTIISQPLDKVDRYELEGVIEEIEWEIRCLE